MEKDQKKILKLILKLKKTMFKKRIAFLTATRADYGKLKSLILETQKLKNIKTYVLVAGMHNLNFFWKHY